MCVAAAYLSIGVRTCFPSILPFWAEARVPLFLVTRQKAAQRPLWSLVSVFSQPKSSTLETTYRSCEGQGGRCVCVCVCPPL